MAVTCVEAAAEDVDTSNTTSYAFAAFTPAANSLLVVLVFASATAAAGSMSGGSLVWTLLDSQVYNTADKGYMFYAQCPEAPASTTITFSCTGDAATGAAMMAFSFTGHNTFDPIAQSAKNATTAENPVATFATAMNTANAYAAGFGMPRNPPTSAAPSTGGGWSEIADTGYANPSTGISGALRNQGETGTTVTFTSASAAYGILAIEVNDATVGKSAVDPCGAAGMCGI